MAADFSQGLCMSIDFPKPGVPNAFEGLSLKLAEDLVGIEQCKPVTLIEDFPRIMERINETWPGRSAVEYIESLIISDRIDREGFPPKVLSELCFLKELQTFLYPLAFETNRRVEDLIHSPFQVRSIKALVDLYGPKNGMGMMAPAVFESRDPLYDSPFRPTGWGEIDSDAKLTEVLIEPRRPLARLGEILVKHELISVEDRDEALALQASKAGPGKRREPLGKVLVEAGKLEPMDLRKALVLQSQGLLVNLDLLTIAHPAFALVPRAVAVDLGAVVLQIHGQTLAVALENPLAYRGKRAIDALKKITGLTIRHAWASAPSIERKLQNYRAGRVRRDF